MSTRRLYTYVGSYCNNSSCCFKPKIASKANSYCGAPKVKGNNVNRVNGESITSYYLCNE